MLYTNVFKAAQCGTIAVIYDAQMSVLTSVFAMYQFSIATQTLPELSSRRRHCRKALEQMRLRTSLSATLRGEFLCCKHRSCVGPQMLQAKIVDHRVSCRKIHIFSFSGTVTYGLNAIMICIPVNECESSFEYTNLQSHVRLGSVIVMHLSCPKSDVFDAIHELQNRMF